MSGSLSPTVAATPTAVNFASSLLGLMASLNGVATDYNQGSEVRTFSESNGLIVEQQGIANQALALQALVYGAMSLFGITAPPALAATGILTFATALPVSAAFPATQAVAIPSGTLAQTNGGVQFSTIANAVLASGTPSINLGIIATTPGAAGNVGSGAITGSPLTPLGYPIYVSNAAPTTGGAQAGTFSQALAQFTAKAASLGLCSPVNVANAAIGLAASGGFGPSTSTETVVKAACYEPWIAAGSGVGSGQAGFTLFIDNGTGTASPALVQTVQAWLLGSTAQNLSGYRAGGMPFAVSAVTAIFANVGVTGVLLPGLFTTGAVGTSISSSVGAYFNNLGISPAAAYQPQVAAQVADAGLNGFSSLTVNLYYTTASGTAVALVSGGVGTRVILNSLSVNLSVGS